jgi:hypothetical protein
MARLQAENPAFFSEVVTELKSRDATGLKLAAQA